MKSKKKVLLNVRPIDRSTRGPAGVGWYTAEEWAKVKASATDAERFEASFSEWEVVAEKFMVDIRQQGISARKSFIVASELLAWCLATGKVNNGATRAQFVLQQVDHGKEISASLVPKI